jgi:hypothetical protein
LRIRHKGTARAHRQAKRFGNVIRHRLDIHANPAAPHTPRITELRHHARCQIGRDGKTKPGRNTAR